MQTLASDLEPRLLNKLAPFGLDEAQFRSVYTDSRMKSLCKTGSQDEAKAYVDEFVAKITCDWDRFVTSGEPNAGLWLAVIESIINWLSEDIDITTYNNRLDLENNIITLAVMLAVENSNSRAGPSTPEASVQDTASDTSDDAEVPSLTYSDSSAAYSDSSDNYKAKTRRFAVYKGKPRWIDNLSDNESGDNEIGDNEIGDNEIGDNEIGDNESGSGNNKEVDLQNIPQKRKAEEVFAANDDKIVGSPRKKPYEQDSIAETGFLGNAVEPSPDKEAGEEMDLDKAKDFPETQTGEYTY
ncbi:hypothetical protein CKAH01_07720 [Colletotrichum kahawae]|uniref:Uncharacterized protein n=1 Tax=Colletotrichum kahawae TaxID=34407 RepID=A0AAD9Y4R5_COLKA|nr:hypothetical protein CKAH01_07720 [Colletotrichum kahawae]